MIVSTAAAHCTSTPLPSARTSSASPVARPSALPNIAVVLTSTDDACHAPRLARMAGARGFVAKARLCDADLDAMFTR